MADDLEAFLRQAAQRRAQKGPAAQKRPAQQGAGRSPTARSGVAPRAQPTKAVHEVLVEPEVVPETLSTLTSHVETSSFARRAEHFADDVEQADEIMEAHLHDKFDRQVGTLVARDAPSYFGSEPRTRDESLDLQSLILLLQDPKTLAQAVVLSEILSPPRNRW